MNSEAGSSPQNNACSHDNMTAVTPVAAGKSDDGNIPTCCQRCLPFYDWHPEMPLPRRQCAMPLGGKCIVSSVLRCVRCADV